MDDERVPPSAKHIVTVIPVSTAQEYRICSVNRITSERLTAACVYKNTCLSHAGSMQDNHMTSRWQLKDVQAFELGLKL